LAILTKNKNKNKIGGGALIAGVAVVVVYLKCPFNWSYAI
jgi:hypothetical protein